MSETPKAQWPGKAYDSAGDDLTAGLRVLLQDMRLLETKSDEQQGVGLLSGTPQSLQVITAGATDLTKTWTALTAALGGGGAMFAAISTFWNQFGGGVEGAIQRSALMASAGILASSVVFAVAVMIRADVTGRSHAQAAIYAARGQVAASFLRTVESGLPKPPPGPSYLVKKGDDWKRVESFEWESDDMIAVVQGDRIPRQEWSGLIAAPEV